MLKEIGDIIETVETVYNADHSIKSVSTTKGKLLWGLISPENITLKTSIDENKIIECLKDCPKCTVKIIQIAYYGDLTRKFNPNKPTGI